MNDAPLETRLLNAEGQIQALAKVVMHLVGELEVRHGFDSELFEQTMKRQHWDGRPLEPYAISTMQDLASKLAEARQHRLYSMLYEKYGLDLDLSALRQS